MITKADKGNSIVMLYQNDYTTKVNDFLDDNNFAIETKDPTNKFQKDVRNSINQRRLIVPKERRWKYINLNPNPPVMRGLLKIHKPDSRIRPVINWKNAAVYKLEN
jgi:hypothetical protein